MYWSKTHEIKSKYKFNLYSTFEIINSHNWSCRKLFFLPLLNPFFHYSNLSKVFNWLCTSQKAVCSHQNTFFLQNKRLNNPIWVGRHAKKRFKVVQARFKNITCVPLCHNVNQMKKNELYPNFDPFRKYFNKNYWEKPSISLIMTCYIKPLKPFLTQIVTRYSKEVFWNLILVVLQSSSIATHGSWGEWTLLY